MNTKQCAKCGNHLPISEFTKNNRASDGLYSYCRTCTNLISKDKYQKKKLKSKPINYSLSDRNPNFIGYSDRDLQEELRARGWRGNLEYTVTKSIKI